VLEGDKSNKQLQCNISGQAKHHRSSSGNFAWADHHWVGRPFSLSRSVCVSPCALTAPAACSALRKPAKVSCCRKKERREREKKAERGINSCSLSLSLLIATSKLLCTPAEIKYIFYSPHKIIMTFFITQYVGPM
jgi:hypothetical protein